MNTELDVKVLTAIKCEIIQEKRHELVKTLNAERHIDYLRSKFLLSEEDAQEISNCPSKQKKAGVFLDLIFKNGPRAYDKLCESLLIERTQIFLLEMLNKEYEKRLNIYKGLVNRQLLDGDLCDDNQTTIPLSVDQRSLPKPSSVRLNQQKEHDESVENNINNKKSEDIDSIC
ncbi:hypothetical protein SNE40_000355 [Patella caerulea]|uniref:CARD domain-containing protein n=1 Tax=Patella caerulea TaxID=87958 RepID=A0AAN8Q9X0_PATCE